MFLFVMLSHFCIMLVNPEIFSTFHFLNILTFLIYLFYISCNQLLSYFVKMFFSLIEFRFSLLVLYLFDVNYLMSIFVFQRIFLIFVILVCRYLYFSFLFIYTISTLLLLNFARNYLAVFLYLYFYFCIYSISILFHPNFVKNYIALIIF